MVSSGLVSNGNFNRLRVNAVNVNNTTNSLLNIKKGVIYEHYSRQVIQEYKYNLDSNLLKNINESEKNTNRWKIRNYKCFRYWK